MPVVFQFWGNQVGTLESVDDDGNGNSIISVGETPFLSTDRVLVTFSNDSFDENGEFLADGPIIILEVRVIRDDQIYDLAVPSDTKVKESGEGSNKEQGDTFFITNDEIGPPDSGPFADIPTDQYVFVTGTTLTGGTVTIARQDGADGNSNFDMDHGLNNVICFGRGTRIMTPCGEVPVEELFAGDLVETRDHGARPIRWINSRYVPAVPQHLWPIRVAPGTFGPGLPHSELDLSPQHRICLEGAMSELLFGEREVLTAAKTLINDLTIRPVRPPLGIEYFHFCFEHHEIVSANGLPCESFFPGQEALVALETEARSEIQQLFPDLCPRDLRPGMSTARYVLRGYETQVLMARANDILDRRQPHTNQAMQAA